MGKFSSLLAGSAAPQTEVGIPRVAALGFAPLSAAGASRQADALALGGGSTLRLVLRGLVFAALYFVAMIGAIELARFGGDVAPIWVASPIMAWALLTAPYRDWPVLIGFTAIAHAAAGAIVGDQLAMEAVYLVANLASPILCAALLLRRSDGLEFEDRGSLFRFLLICTFSAAASAAVIALWTLASTRQIDFRSTGTWFLSDGLSFVVFLPIFRSLASGGWRVLLAPNVRKRTIVLFGLLLVALVSHWFTPDAFRRVFPTILVPYLIFMVFELGPASARGVVALTTVSFLAYAFFASESARRGLPPVDYLFSVQIYLAAVIACLLPLAAVLAEKQKLYETASQSLSDAQAAWGDLIAAEAHYRLLADNMQDMVLRLGLDGAILFASPACRVLASNVESLTGQSLMDLAHADDVALSRDRLASLATGGAADKPHTIRLRLKGADGAVRPYDVRVTLVASRGKAPDEFIAVLRQVQQ